MTTLNALAGAVYEFTFADGTVQVLPLWAANAKNVVSFRMIDSDPVAAPVFKNIGAGLTGSTVLDTPWFFKRHSIAPGRVTLKRVYIIPLTDENGTLLTTAYDVAECINKGDTSMAHISAYCPDGTPSTTAAFLWRYAERETYEHIRNRNVPWIDRQAKIKTNSGMPFTMDDLNGSAVWRNNSIFFPRIDSQFEKSEG